LRDAAALWRGRGEAAIERWRLGMMALNGCTKKLNTRTNPGPEMSLLRDCAGNLTAKRITA
jgi:hypothetical protein